MGAAGGAALDGRWNRQLCFPRQLSRALDVAAGDVTAWGHGRLCQEQGRLCPLAGRRRLCVGRHVTPPVEVSGSFRVISDSLIEVCPFPCTQVVVASPVCL